MSLLTVPAGVSEKLNLDYQRILSSTAHFLLQDNDPDVLCQTIFETLRASFKLDLYFHFLVSADRSCLELASSGGNEVVRKALGMKLQFGEAVCGTVAERCEWMHVTNVQARTDAMTRLIRSYGVRCYTCQPLISRGMVIGTLSFGSTTRDEFTGEELELFRVLAQQVTLTTQRRMEQEQIRRLEQLALAGRVSANLAHEINNPLDSLNNILYMLRTETLSRDGRELLHNAEMEVKRLTETTQRTLDMYRGRTQQAHVVDLSALLQDVAANTTLPKRTRLSSQIQDGLCVHAVVGELRQVLLNLLINAAQFTPEGGTVTLTAAEQDGFAMVAVQDEGPGISEASRPQIFQPFYTTRANGGTGVGLWVSRELVERVGGTLTFRSTPELEKGTEFTMRLPLDEPRSQQTVN